MLRVAATGLPGDYNQNGVVDAADYVVWRKGLGITYTQEHYNIWRANFGRTPGSGAAIPSAATLSAAVPEPAAWAMMLGASVWWHGGLSGAAEHVVLLPHTACCRARRLASCYSRHWRSSLRIWAACVGTNNALDESRHRHLVHRQQLVRGRASVLRNYIHTRGDRPRAIRSSLVFTAARHQRWKRKHNNLDWWLSFQHWRRFHRRPIRLEFSRYCERCQRGVADGLPHGRWRQLLA